MALIMQKSRYYCAGSTTTLCMKMKGHRFNTQYFSDYSHIRTQIKSISSIATNTVLVDMSSVTYNRPALKGQSFNSQKKL